MQPVHIVLSLYPSLCCVLSLTTDYSYNSKYSLFCTDTNISILTLYNYSVHIFFQRVLTFQSLTPPHIMVSLQLAAPLSYSNLTHGYEIPA